MEANPALMTSSLMEQKQVALLPARIRAEQSSHGPWQMAATGLPGEGKKKEGGSRVGEREGEKKGRQECRVGKRAEPAMHHLATLIKLA